MARDGSGVYTLPPGSIVTNGQITQASQHNDPLNDIEADLNAPRPVSAGGTGAGDAATALSNLGGATAASVIAAQNDATQALADAAAAQGDATQALADAAAAQSTANTALAGSMPVTTGAFLITVEDAASGGAGQGSPGWQGTYTKIGSLCLYSFVFSSANPAGFNPSGLIFIHGFPFNFAANPSVVFGQTSVVQSQQIASASLQPVFFRAEPNTDYGFLEDKSGNALTFSDFSSSLGNNRMTGTFQVQ